MIITQKWSLMNVMKFWFMGYKKIGISNMATFFGEIIPSYSRAVDDDEDDIEPENTEDVSVRWSPAIKLEIMRLPKQKLPCQIMIVALGPAAAGFVQAYILDNDFYIVGALFSGMSDQDWNTFEQTAPTDKTCYIYRSRSRPTVFVCSCKTDVSAEQAHSWVDQLFSCIDSEDPATYMTILCTYMVSEFKSDTPTSDMDTPFLRTLKSSKYAGTPTGPYLEQPNMISGLPAQLLTFSQTKNMRAVMYICYTDSIYLDSDTIRIFQPLLQSTPIKDVVKENPKAEEAMKNIVHLYSQKNSLYL